MSTQLALITQSSLSDIADAIRAKNGSSDEYTPAGMATAIAAIPSGGGGEQRYTITNGVLDGITGDITIDCTSVAQRALAYGFYYCTGITSLSFPHLTQIGNNGLESIARYASSLASVSMPLLESVGNSGLSAGFADNGTLETIAFPSLQSLGQSGMSGAFQNCTHLRDVTFPELASTGNSALGNAFRACPALTSISFPKLTSINSGTFGALAFQNTGITAFHFRADAQSAVEASSSYSTLWGRGAGNATVYFDL